MNFEEWLQKYSADQFKLHQISLTNFEEGYGEDTLKAAWQAGYERGCTEKQVVIDELEAILLEQGEFDGE